MQPPSETRLAEAISALGTGAFAARLLSWIDSSLAADNVTMLLWQDGGGPEALLTRSAEKNVHARFESAYRTGAYLLDPFHALDRDGAAPGLYRLQDIAPDQFTRSDYYLSYYRGTTLLDEIVYLIRPAAGLSIHLCLGRDVSSGRRFTAREMEEAIRIDPLVQALGGRQWEGLRARPSAGSAEEDVLAGLWQGLSARHGIQLTRRQAEIAMLILKGHSSVSVAARLGISPQTVKVFRKQIYARCGISSQAELFSLMMPLLSRPGRS